MHRPLLLAFAAVAFPVLALSDVGQAAVVCPRHADSAR